MQPIKVLISYEEVDNSVQAFILDGMLIAENLGISYDGQHLNFARLREIPNHPGCFELEKEYFYVHVGPHFDLSRVKTMDLSNFLVYTALANDKVEAYEATGFTVKVSA